jgi:hypothetical protein
MMMACDEAFHTTKPDQHDQRRGYHELVCHRIQKAPKREI